MANINYIEVLEKDLKKGFTKSDLERLIGLPKNNLSSILSRNRKLSRKSELKIEKWEASEKPNPLDIEIGKKVLEGIEKGGWNEAVAITPPTTATVHGEKIEMKIVDKKIHPLYKEGDPKENSMAFHLKYDCMTYDELQAKLKD